MTKKIQNKGSKEPAERSKAHLAETQHRFEISDPRTDATYRFQTAEAVTAKADELGATRFQGRTADSQVYQISKIDGDWKRNDGKALADIQAEIDKASVKAIKARAEQRAAAGQGVDAETDRQMALADARDFRRIQNPDWQDSAAEQITENARVNANYKAFDAAIVADRTKEKAAPEVVQNSIALNERSQELPKQAAAPDDNQSHTDPELDPTDKKKAKPGNT
jgi:hypothetical protein